jgi:hypothetical protein
MSARKVISRSILMILAISLFAFPGALRSSVRAGDARAAVAVYAAHRGNPWINLRDGTPLPLERSGPAALVEALEGSQAQPLALAAGDFDEDGVPDLVSGWRTSSQRAPGGGLLTLYRGNLDSIYPDSPQAQARKAAGTFTEAAFLSPAYVFDPLTIPDFLVAGDFDGDGHWDVAAAARGGSALHLLPGDGRGGFAPVVVANLPGAVTALAAGEVNRRDGLQDIIIGVSAPGGAQLLVFEDPAGALKGAPEVIPLPGQATSLAIGQMDDHPAMDIAAAAGDRLLIVHGRDRRGEQSLPAIDDYTLSEAAVSLALGDFIVEESYRKELAALSASGTVRILDPLTGIELAQSAAGIDARSLSTSLLAAVNVSSLPGDDLAILDPLGRQLRLLVLYKPGTTGDGPSPEAPVAQDTILEPWSVALDTSGAPAAVLPMRLNPDAFSDLVILQSGVDSPVVLLTAPMAIFTVNNNGAQPDGDTTDGICDTGNATSGYTGICTLMAAVDQANASPGADAIQFDLGSGTPTIQGGYVPAIADPVTLLGNTGGATRVELAGAGLSVSGGSSTIRALVINGATPGIRLWYQPGNIVEDCYVGTDAAGTVALQNSFGVQINHEDNTIGGTTTQARNVISGNENYGIYLGEFLPYGRARDNLVQGNYIGVNASGTAALGNKWGVYVYGDAVQNNTIRDNVISGNINDGLRLFEPYNLFLGNWIGTDQTGNADLGNGQYGMYLYDDDTTVGGTTPGVGNTIAYNHADGIDSTIPQFGHGRNRISGNSIHDNWGLGIDVQNYSGYGAGPSANDAWDYDMLQNWPEIAQVRMVGGQMEVTFRVDSASTLAAYPLSIEFFQADGSDSYAEGMTYLGSVDYLESEAQTFVTKSFVPRVWPTEDFPVVATTTDADGNTSEFSFPPITGTVVAIVVNSTSDLGDSNPTDELCWTGVTLDTGDMECTLRAAIQTTNAMGGGLIRFDIPSTGFPTIQLLSPLPDVTEPAQIDGNWQPQGMVELDGSNAGASADGLHITAGDSLVQGLIINRFGGEGIYLGTAGGNTLRGNWIGVDRNGTGHAANGYGIAMDNSANNVIGGTGGELQRNVISGNTWAGVIISGEGSTGNRVQNSYVGVNQYGNANLYNGGPGVSIEGASNNIIGGTTAEQRNVISGNKAAGVMISGSGATGNKVQGSYIGVQANGAGWMANTGPGVRIVSGSNNQIGGVDSGAGNVIAFNTGEGVLVEWGEGNAILSNSIHSNEKLGIDLWGDGITNNDPGDGDTGPNLQQNFPTFTEMHVNGGILYVTGEISSTANTSFRLEFFSNDGFTEDGSVQGRDFRATTTVTTNGEGLAVFTVQMPDVGTAYTATATRLDASGQPLHTSEFTPIDVDIIAVEITQAIQDTANSIPLVALKPTYVLVHVRGLGAAEIPNIQAQLTGYRDAAQLGTISSMPAAISVVRFPRRQLASSSFFFPLPREWVMQTGELRVEVEVNFAPRQKQEANYANNQQTATATIESEPWLRMRLCDVSITTITGLVLDSPEPGTAAGIQSMVTAMYPIPTLHVEYCSLFRFYVGPTDMLATLQVNKDLTEMRTWDRLWGEVDADMVYYGIIPGVSRGQADPLNPVASSGDGDEETTDRWVYETGAHELGHVFGRWHTCSPEGGEWYCDSSYPHTGGTISKPPTGAPFSEYLPGVFYGYDSTSSNPIHMHNAIDIMSYNPGGRWISDYTYLSLMNTRDRAAHANASQPALQEAGAYLMATGLITPTQQTASLDSLYLLPEVVSQTLPAPGDFDLRLLDSGGATLADYPFAAAASIPPEGEPVAIFSLLVPFLDGTTQVQVISGTQVLAARLVSSNAPTVTITSPLGGEVVTGTLSASWTASDADEDDLTYTLFYSADDGQTWNMLTTGWTSDTIDLDTLALPGSQQARLRVLVNDGVKTGQADSAAFEVTTKLPSSLILLPEDGQEFAAGELVSLQGVAWDAEDGSLGEAALVWSDSVSGMLGTGSILYTVSLSPGWHTITLTATDSDGMSTSVSVTIRVGWMVYLPVIVR